MPLWTKPPTEGQTILLFFADYERDSFIPGDRYLKRLIRPAYNLVSHRQKVFGFQMWFRLLVTALRSEGYDVRVNDFATARKYPDYPVGLAGYPSILGDWTLPNPAVLGPGMYDHPSQCPDLFDDPRYRRYLVTCDWNRAVFAPVYGSNRCVDWYGALELKHWPDQSRAPKQFDFLVYRKIRWDIERQETELMAPIFSELERRGLTWTELRYNQHDHRDYRHALAASRALLFVCEHETQGLAYQEAMASGLPVLAWDPGTWQDPLQKSLGLPCPIRTSSVPHFASTCGRTFRCAEDFPAALDDFLAERDTFDPRGFVVECLSQQGSAERYARAYFGLLEPTT